MYCPNCRFNNAPDARFCENCGYALPQDSRPGGRSFTTIFPAMVNLISAVILSIIALGIIIFVLVAVNQAISLVSFLPINFYNLGGSYIILFTIGLVLALFLPPIIISFLAFNGLWNLEASGYKWGLVTSFYLLLYLLTYLSSPLERLNWVCPMLLSAIPLTSIICLLLDRNLSKSTNNQLEVISPAILSLTIFCSILHSVIISGVTILFLLLPSTAILPYMDELNSIAGGIPGLAMAITIVISLIIILIIIALLILFYKLYKGLMGKISKYRILGIVVFSLLTLFLILAFATGNFINFWGILLMIIFALQVVLLSLKDTGSLFYN